MAKFEGKNNLSNPHMFEERLQYKQKAFTVYDPIPLDMIYEKPFYGKVDKKGIPIYPTEANMTQLPGQGLILAHNFAAKAFYDLKGMIDYHLRSPTGRFSNLFPSGFMPFSAFKSVHKLYQDHFVGVVYDVFINDYIIASRKRRVKNFRDFVSEFVDFAASVNAIFPISRTGYIMSPLCPHAISGLVIDIADLDASDDETKQELYLSKSAFSDYAKLAAANGFYVDKNCPWRLAVNMDHPSTSKNMSAFGTSYKNGSVFRDYFYKSELFSFEDFKARLWYGYKSFSEEEDTSSYGMVYGVKNCGAPTWASVSDGQYKTVYKAGTLELISNDYEGEFQKKYPDSFFLPFYFKLRLTEGKKELSPRKYKNQLDKIMFANRVIGLEKAMELLEVASAQSNIYVPNKNSKSPQRIKYFGKNTTSGLHSYEERDKVTLYGFSEEEPKDFTVAEELEAEPDDWHYDDD